MSLEQQIKDDMKSAMKAGTEGKLKLGVIRMLQADLTNVKIDLKLQEIGLDDTQVKEVVKSFVKKLDQEIEGLRSGNRDTSMQEAQKTVVMGYLPTQLTDEQIEAIVLSAIVKTGAVAKTDMGKVMGALKDFREVADMKVVKAVVESKLV